MQPRRRPGWADARAYYARALAECGRLEEGERVCRETIDQQEAGETDVVVMQLEPHRQLGLIEARLGRTEEAARRLDQLLSTYADRGPVTVGGLHQARAWIALEARDKSAFEYHARVMRELFRS
ncbi:MAG: hypothetical protein ACOC5B_02805, partial [Myxococcota bacterium]